MARRDKANYIMGSFLCICAVPFLTERLQQFLFEAWKINCKIPVVSAIVLAAVLSFILLFAKKITFPLGIPFVVGFWFGCFISPTLVAPNTYEVWYVIDALGSAVFSGFYFSLWFSAFKSLKIKKSKGEFGFFVITAVFLNLIAVLYMLNSNTVYYWDNAGYWRMSAELAEGLKTNALKVFSGLYTSVIHDDYNNLAALPSALLAMIFGKSRLVYVLGIVNFYMLPFMLIFRRWAVKNVRKPGFVCFFVLMMCPYVIYMTLLGFVDIGGIIMVMLCYKLYGEADDGNCNKMFLIGSLLAGCALFRRWYMFFAASFLIVAFFRAIKNGKRFAGYMTMLGSFLFMYLFFFQQYVTGKLLANYSYMYSAYKVSLVADYFMIVRYYGIVLLVLGIAFICKKYWYIPVQMFLCFMWFTTVQTHGQQHLLLYTPGFMIMLVVMIGWLEERMKAKIFVPLVVCMGIVVSGNVLIDRVQPADKVDIKSHAMIPNFEIKPPERNDIDTLVELKHYIKKLCKDESQAAILSSSYVFNIDILRNLENSIGMKPDPDDVNYLVEVSEVDERDGFPQELFYVKYVVVADPPQVHLTQGQTVIEVPAEAFLKNEGIGQSFKKLDKTFVLDEGVTVSVYEKQQDIPNEVYYDLKARLSK